VEITKIVEINCHCSTVLFWQRGMEFIKTEPDPGAELYPASCSTSQLFDVKEEVKPVLVSFPLMKTGHNGSCLCVCLLLVKCHSIELLAMSVVPVFKCFVF
jgi:hypothetical protein